MNKTLPIRILQVSYSMDLGGAETLIMNLYRNIDRTKVQFDFLLHAEEESAYEEEIIKLGGKIYRIPRFLGYNKLSYDKALREFLSNHPEHIIIHDHLMDSASETFHIAKKMGRITISHSHTEIIEKSLEERIRFFFRKDLYKNADYRFACSNKAGEWLYRNKADFSVIKNGIETDKYAFNEETRKEKRRELGLADNDYIIGTVGRLVEQKNQKRTLEIFSDYLKTNEKGKLVIVGDGPLRETLEKTAKALDIEDNVLFLGSRRDVSSILMAFDIFILTSFSEGLGIVLIEAMASGLSCVFSDSIPHEVDIIPELIKRISLDSGNSEWLKAINESSKDYNRTISYKRVKDCGYDIEETAKKLESFYLSLY